ncbi:MAG: S9 family peptidase [Candidatus Kapabacteria bacterium]|nr:S9 family peptidase [Candidatus Kapabacteria bacterium]
MTARKLPLEDFFRHAERGGYALSANGNQLAYAEPDGDVLSIVVEDRSTGERQVFPHPGGHDITPLLWKGDRILYLLDESGDENFLLYAVDVTTGTHHLLTPFENTQVRLVSSLRLSPVDIFIEVNNRIPECFDVYRLNTMTGEYTCIVENPGTLTQWLVSADGIIRSAAEIAGTATRILYRTESTSEWYELMTIPFTERFVPLHHTEQKTLVCASSLGRNTLALVEYDPQSNTELRTLYAHDEFDIAHFPEIGIFATEWSYVHNELSSVWLMTDTVHVHCFSEHARKMYERLAHDYPNALCSLYTQSADERTAVILVIDDRRRGTYLLYSADTETFVQIGDAMPWLTEADTSPVHPIRYTARDGRDISAYLTLPHGIELASAQQIPTVVLVHGGPSARDFFWFNSEVQFFANRGYAVVQPQFRGSIGYGKDHWMAGFKQWGRAMQDDITDCVAWLVANSITDPKRVAIYGTSYGGYSALAGLTFTPDLFACGIDLVGPSNIASLIEAIPPYWEAEREMIYETVGNPSTDSEYLAEVSPLFHAERITKPLLIGQGANDPRVPQAESDRMVEALRQHGIPVTYILKEGEGHGFTQIPNLIEWYTTVEEFLDRWIGSGAGNSEGEITR